MNQSSETIRDLREWAFEVKAAYEDGGYAAGDGPEPPDPDVVLRLLKVVDAAQDALEVLSRYHEWVAQHNEARACGGCGRMGLDHPSGGNVEGCSNCGAQHALAAALNDLGPIQP